MLFMQTTRQKPFLNMMDDKYERTAETRDLQNTD